MSSPLVGPPVVKAKTMYCPNCGGPVEFRGFGHALTVVCPQCLTVLDASSPLLKIVQEAQDAQSRRSPLIPLGARGKLAGATWETIGFQTRSVEEDGVLYEWEEYLLFNPYKGFRYLTNYDGHWNFVTPVESLPERRAIGSRPAVYFEGNLYKHFSGAQAITVFVIGEFPWRVKAGEEVVADDFIHPPFVLSSETTSDEVTWSKGEYTHGADIWKAFGLTGPVPRAQGVYLNQPSPYGGKVGGTWGVFAVMLLALLVIAIMFGALSPGDTVLDEHYQYSTADRGEPSFVTKDFEIQGRTSNLEVAINTNLINNWAYFNLTLINEGTGDAFDFGREVSYYAGRDSDGSWSEGGQSSTVIIPRVPAGRYYLRVEPEMEGSETPSAAPSAAPTVAPKPAPKPVPTQQRRPPPMNVKTVYYEIVLRHDVATYGWFWLTALLLLIPPIFSTIRARSFEVRRWSTSDYPMTSGGG
jgi:hypothetical protein